MPKWQTARASVYYRCQNSSSFNRHQDTHIPFCVAFWASPSVLAEQQKPHCRSIPQAAWSQLPYSRRDWQSFSAPSYTIYLSKQFSRSVSVFNRWINYSISAWVNRGKKLRVAENKNQQRLTLRIYARRQPLCCSVWGEWMSSFYLENE